MVVTVSITIVVMIVKCTVDKKLLAFVCSVSDSLDDIFDESGDEEEQDAVVSQVLDEIGIEISGKVCALIIAPGLRHWTSTSSNRSFVKCTDLLLYIRPSYYLDG